MVGCSRFLTLEKKALIVDSFAKFRIKKVEKYYTATSGDQRRAEELLKQRINNGLRNEISKRTLHEVVSGQRDELMIDLVASLNEVANQELGVEVVDVRVKRIDLPQEVSQSVYNRMNTERDIEAKEHRAKGQELFAVKAMRKRLERMPRPLTKIKSSTSFIAAWRRISAPLRKRAIC